MAQINKTLSQFTDRFNFPLIGPREASIAQVSAGGTTDAEARTALNSIIDTLERHGFIAPSNTEGLLEEDSQWADSDQNPILGMRQPAIADPTGGATQDSQLRAFIVAVLDYLRAHGLIEGGTLKRGESLTADRLGRPLLGNAQAELPDVFGGATQDTNARAKAAQVKEKLEKHGLSKGRGPTRYSNGVSLAFGASGTIDEDPNGYTWNVIDNLTNLNAADPGITLVDHAGNALGVLGTTGGKLTASATVEALSTTDYTDLSGQGSASDIPLQAIRGNIVNTSASTFDELFITGLPANMPIRIKLFGARGTAAGGATCDIFEPDVHGTLDDGDQTDLLTVFDTSAATPTDDDIVAIFGRTDESGCFALKVRRGNTVASYLSILRIEWDERYVPDASSVFPDAEINTLGLDLGSDTYLLAAEKAGTQDIDWELRESGTIQWRNGTGATPYINITTDWTNALGITKSDYAARVVERSSSAGNEPSTNFDSTWTAFSGAGSTIIDAEQTTIAPDVGGADWLFFTLEIREVATETVVARKNYGIYVRRNG